MWAHDYMTVTHMEFGTKESFMGSRTEVIIFSFLCNEVHMIEWYSCWLKAQQFHLTSPSFTWIFGSFMYYKAIGLWCQAQTKDISIKGEVNP